MYTYKDISIYGRIIILYSIVDQEQYIVHPPKHIASFVLVDISYVWGWQRDRDTRPLYSSSRLVTCLYCMSFTFTKHTHMYIWCYLFVFFKLKEDI